MIVLERSSRGVSDSAVAEVLLSPLLPQRGILGLLSQRSGPGT